MKTIIFLLTFFLFSTIAFAGDVWDDDNDGKLDDYDKDLSAVHRNLVRSNNELVYATNYCSFFIQILQ